MGACILDDAEVERHDEGFVPVGAGFGEDFARGAGDEALSPELDAFAGQLFVPDAVGHHDVTTISDGMGALDRLPGRMLPLAQRRLPKSRLRDFLLATAVPFVAQKLVDVQ